MRTIALGVVFLLAACGEAAPLAPPPNALQPDEIDYLAIKTNALYGGGCNFVAEGGGISALVLAQEKDAVLKLKGRIVRVPADPASKPLPEGAHTRYADAAYVLTLVPAGEARANGVVKSMGAAFTITDAAGKPLFAAKGQVQCKPM